MMNNYARLIALHRRRYARLHVITGLLVVGIGYQRSRIVATSFGHYWSWLRYGIVAEPEYQQLVVIRHRERVNTGRLGDCLFTIINDCYAIVYGWRVTAISLVTSHCWRHTRTGYRSHCYAITAKCFTAVLLNSHTLSDNILLITGATRNIIYTTAAIVPLATPLRTLNTRRDIEYTPLFYCLMVATTYHTGRH